MGSWIATVCLLASTLSTGGEPPSTSRPSLNLALGKKLAGEFRHRSPESLLRFAEGAIERFFLDEQEFAVDTTVDLADLVAAATSLDLLLERQTPPARALLLATRTASILHRLGWRYDNDPELRRRIAQVGATGDDKASATAGAALRDALANFRQVGKQWFWKLLPTAERLHPKNPIVLNLKGLALKQQGDLEGAHKAFEQALQQRPRPVFALNLYEVALRRGRAGTPELKRQLIARIPALKTALEHVDAVERDRQKTDTFERGPVTKEPEALLAQAERYLRLRKQPSGDALVREALSDRNLSQELAYRAALYWMASGRDGRAVELIEKRRDRGGKAWNSLRLTLAVRTRLDALVAPHASVPPEVKKNWLELPNALARLRRGGSEAALQADVVELFLAVREVHAAKASDDLKAEAASRAKLARLRRVLKSEHAASELAAFARAGAVLATETPAAVVSVMREAIVNLPRPSASRFPLVLAEQEVGLGLRLGKLSWVESGLKRARVLQGLDGTWELRRRYLVAVGGWLAIQAKGRVPSTDDTRRVIERLKSLIDQGETSTAMGRDYAGAVGLSLGGLALTVGEVEMAHRSLQWSRRFLQRPLTQLAAAVAGLGRYQDAYGASVYLDRALRQANGPHLRFALHKWRALAANRRGAVTQARQHLSEMLKLAKDAGIPQKLNARSGVPLTLGSLAMVVSLAPLGSPGAVRVETGSVVLILPSFSHDLAQVRQMLRELSASP